ncbi:ABC transporter [Salmonella enterica subsp. enterica serovar Enteritidis]|nr:ABC transporter [Salmonella enterica subsp. enterica serovar Gateshead]EGU1064705.1 ABC transporter [Salmonella enterica subsp. enterica serovar Enteritidis]EHF2786277.1 ABC transporter [Salmonella enterica subsp. enterica serovar Enteritidis]
MVILITAGDNELNAALFQVIEITPERVVDFSGNYDDYLRSKGIES